MKAYLALEDGTVHEGKGIGIPGTTSGELVFETGMTGYVEALTDPSYNGQILMFTYPLIGNYGVNSGNFESDGIKTRGLVVKELCTHPSHWSSEKSLDEFLKEQEMSGIQGVDTRMITKKVRVEGTMRSVLSVGREDDKDELVAKARELPRITEMPGLVKDVSIPDPVSYENGNPYKIVLIDCGFKKSILDDLLRDNYDVTIVPYDASPDDILDLDPHGVLISNGPGDPSLLDPTVDTVTKLLSELPLFGICLGHLIIAQACGARTFKLKFGHRGLNQPVKILSDGKVYMTTQNHGFAVSKSSLKDTPLNTTQINLNDGTMEGIEHEEYPVFGVQYHPEANPGPHDTKFFFKKMANMIQGYRK